MRKSARGFTVLELFMLVAVLTILLAIGLPYLARMRDNNAINAAADLLRGEFQFAQGEAKAFGISIDPTFKAGPIDGTADEVVFAEGFLAGRMRRRATADGPIETLKFFKLGDNSRMQLQFENVPLVLMEDEPLLTGTVLEIGTSPDSTLTDDNFVPAATLAFDANGEVLLNDASQIGLIRMGRIPDHFWQLETSQVGRLTVRRPNS